MATETKVKIDINADFDRLAETVMRVKREHDEAVKLLREMCQSWNLGQFFGTDGITLPEARGAIRGGTNV